jgi:hypothetical protein
LGHVAQFVERAEVPEEALGLVELVEAQDRCRRTILAFMLA